MAKISFQSIPDGLDITYKKALNPSANFVVPSVRRNVLFSSRRRKKGMSQKSLIPILTPVFNALSDAEKAAWASAGAVQNTRSFNLFLRDTSYRIKAEIPGYATPSDLYQVLEGRMEVSDPATGMTIAQLHPFTYYIYKKIAGTKTQYAPVQVTEPFTLPIDIEVSCKTELVSAGSGAFAKMYVIVYSNYQGRTIENREEIVFLLSSDWMRYTASVSRVVGVATGYTVFFEIYNAIGVMYFDNVVLSHGGFNWARDPYCNAVRTGYTRAYYQIPRNWIGIDLPVGTFYDSYYYSYLPFFGYGSIEYGDFHYGDLVLL